MAAPEIQSLPLRQQLLEQCDRSGVVRLAEPEDGLLADLGVTVRARDANQNRDAFVARALRQGEHDLLLHLAVDTRILRQGIEARARRVARCLAQPEHRLLARLTRALLIAGQADQRR